MKVKTKKELINEDWKTHIALKQPSIPEGIVLEVKDTIWNFYGKYYEVEYSGYLYYVNPKNVEEVQYEA